MTLDRTFTALAHDRVVNNKFSCCQTKCLTMFAC